MSLRSWLAGWGAPLRVAYRRPEVGAAQQARADVLPTGGEQRAVAGWLAGAEQRRAEPLRQDRPSDVADRLIAATRAGCAAELRAWILHDPGVINADTLADFIADWLA